MVLRETGISGRSLSVAFISDDEIRKVNRGYLGRNQPTDVLSFAYDEKMDDGAVFIGEILIAPCMSVRNAARYRSCPENEIRKLLLHGILHLLGYDHETDDGTMQRLQTRLTRRVFFKKGDPVLKRFKARS
jgi:probable rRNA maturation factor